MPLTDDQRRMLAEPIDPKLVQIKPTAGKPKYLEGVEVIRAANRIFGPDGWGYSTDSIERVDVGGGTLYRAIVTVNVAGCLPKQDVGCEVVGASSPQGHDTAIKGAVTDGVKRALRSFGDPFALSLYDKDADLVGDYREWQREQNQSPAPARTATTAAGGVTAPAPTFAAQTSAAIGQAHEESIAQIKERVRLAAREAGYTLGTWKDWVQLGITLQHPVPDASNSAALTVEWCKDILARLPAPAGV